MNIVFIGIQGTLAAAVHIESLREAGHDVFAVNMDKINYEAAAQKICNADEIHVWLTDGFTASALSFYLGMCYMFHWANTGQNVHFEIKVLNSETLGKEGIFGQLAKPDIFNLHSRP